MTTVGENRQRYALEVERRPSRYFEPAAYREWCERADRWAAANEREQ
ncbi:hypothetical protein [Microbacterium sp. CSI-V]|nr:hypothetical protein [Microbacterium sp. CSI-V]